MLTTVECQNDGCDGDAGSESGNTPMFTSLVRSHVMEGVVSEQKAGVIYGQVNKEGHCIPLAGFCDSVQMRYSVLLLTLLK